MSEIELVFNEWRIKLQLEEFPIKLRILDDREKVTRDYKALIIWNLNENTWELLIPKNIDKSFIIHELGHIFFPKKIKDMRLAP